LDFGNYEEPTLVETDEENSDINSECLFCLGLYTRTDAAKSGLNAHNTNNGAVKSVVETTGTTLFAFSVTLNKSSAHLP
jgi:hypothetical protein